jgi:Transposase IS66 family
VAVEAVKRIDAILAIEREINGLTAEARLAVRAGRSRPLVDDLETWLREQLGKLSSKADLVKAISYLLSRWASFTRFLEDGRVCTTNNAAERAIRPLGRRAPQLDICRFRLRRSARRGHVHADRDLQAQRCRSARLACGRAGAIAGTLGLANW